MQYLQESKTKTKRKSAIASLRISSFLSELRSVGDKSFPQPILSS
ncbi:hypothetical protein [Microcoleus anatoxicus]